MREPLWPDRNQVAGGAVPRRSGIKQEDLTLRETQRWQGFAKKKNPAKKSPASKSPFAERRAFTGPLAYAQTSFLLKQLKQRNLKARKLHPPPSARLTKADLRRVRRGEAEFNVILPTRPFQISVLNKNTLKTTRTATSNKRKAPSARSQRRPVRGERLCGRRAFLSTSGCTSS